MKKPSHRFQIWDLAQEGGSKATTPARSAATSLGSPVSLKCLSRQELRYTDLSNSASPFTNLDDAAMLSSLYDHRLPIDVELPSRCIMPNGRSTSCRTKRISSESVGLVYDLQTAGYPIKPPEVIPAGSTIHLDVDQIGNFHGLLTSQNAEGFQLAVDVDCKGMLISKLTKIAAAIRGIPLDAPVVAARTNITRIEPLVKNCTFVDSMGHLRKGKIINISQIDALIKAPFIPPVGTHVVFSGRQPYVAEITRSFEIGFAVKFCTAIPAEDFSPAIKFLDE